MSFITNTLKSFDIIYISTQTYQGNVEGKTITNIHLLKTFTASDADLFKVEGQTKTNTHQLKQMIRSD